ncbi:VOC family protein [Evansella clarkii]|uniref:VOC family protein n=1 Tax=Evansella clarkii TaxID=79879 RepID=UPI002F260FBA
MMITKGIQITVFVKNQEKAKKFYVEKLGFVVCEEEKLAPGWSYLTVAPQKENEMKLELFQAETPEQKQLIGKQAANQVLVMFATDNIELDYHEMKARGVVFHGEVKTVPGGRGVGFEDLDGNQFDLYQSNQS